MSMDILAPCPTPTAGRLPKSQTVDWAITGLLVMQGLSPEQVHDLVTRMQTKRREIETRYPDASVELTLGERIEADTRTLQAVIRERSRRQFVTQ